LVSFANTPAILSRSPEMFFQTDSAGMIETKPMKGTAPRGHTAQEDEDQRNWLSNDAKNRAENLMIVDLLRNDLSRICEVGSVKVPELFNIETYTTVFQMTSLIQGQLKSGVRFPDILKAMFPCGSITGAPKIRAMEIINELEPSAREVYCGSIGWAAPDGSASFNVAIRTLILYQDNEVVLNVGGGIVSDSTAGAEYEEALWKARFATIHQTTSS
ncbi:MAG: chorismate-binding protein, partial [Candidatus Hydrogenedentes bacterium]|nr:chorismate-binding protein [Candidatus Hydrogenedentota bacterium]